MVGLALSFSFPPQEMRTCLCAIRQALRLSHMVLKLHVSYPKLFTLLLRTFIELDNIHTIPYNHNFPWV